MKDKEAANVPSDILVHVLRAVRCFTFRHAWTNQDWKGVEYGTHEDFVAVHALYETTIDNTVKNGAMLGAFFRSRHPELTCSQRGSVQHY